MKILPPNPTRGLIGLFAWAMIAFGAGAQWGTGAGFFALGMVLWIDASSDEAIERITNTKRGTQ